MIASMSGAARNQMRSTEAPTNALDSQFDPMELLDSNIPFIDPFDYNENDFRESAFSRPNSIHLDCRSPPSSSREAQRTRAVQPLEGMSLQRTPSLPPAGPAHREVSVAPGMLDKTMQVPKLSPGQTIHIFKLGKSLTAMTAGPIAVEYGVTVQDILDIWSLNVAIVGQWYSGHWNLSQGTCCAGQRSSNTLESQLLCCDYHT